MRTQDTSAAFGEAAVDTAGKDAAVSFRERFLEAVLESATDYAIIATDADGLVTVWNEGARLIVGWSEAEMLGRTVETIFTEQDRLAGVPQAEMSGAMQSGRGIDERWHLRRDGTRFWANGELTPLRNPDGSHIGFLKILRDRTEQRLEAERQRVEAEFMRSVLASSADCVKILDLDANLVFMSEGGQRVMEVADFDAIRGCPWPDFWTGPGNAEARAAAEAARKGGVGRFRGMADTLAGNPRWWDVQVTPIRGADGRPERLLSISRDVTEAEMAERSLRESEELRLLAVEAANIGTWYYDPATRALRWDERCKALFGVPADADVTHDGYVRSIHPDDLDRVSAASGAALEPSGHGVYQVEHRVAGAPGGEDKWVCTSGKVDFEGGLAVRMVGTVMDVTARRRAEEQARLLGDELQHRIKNTLAMVQAIVRQTLRNTPDANEAQNAIDQRLAAMARAQDMLARGRWEGSDLRTVVETALAVHSDRADGRFGIEGPTVPLSADAAMPLALLLHELGTNAAKYGALSTPAGRVEISWVASVPDMRGDKLGLKLSWRETGGPPVEPPTRRGFGSTMIEHGLSRAFDGKVTLKFPRDGVVCEVEGRLPAAGAALP